MSDFFVVFYIANWPGRNEIKEERKKTRNILTINE
jgi:hypothetical protein